jgi:hypothetical protein
MLSLGSFLCGLGLLVIVFAVALLPSQGLAQIGGDPEPVGGCNDVVACDTGCAGPPGLCPLIPPAGPNASTPAGCTIVPATTCGTCVCRDTDLTGGVICECAAPRQ